MGLTKQHYERRLKQVDNPLEDDEQIRVIEWCDGSESPSGAEEIFAIPNGGTRNKREASKLKRTGVRSGVSDLMLPVPVGAFHGLFIEMKRKKGGRLSQDQKCFLYRMAGRGYSCAVCHGADQAIEAINEYFGVIGD